MVVVEPEDGDPVADVLPVAVLLQAREEVVEALDPVLEDLVHPLDLVLELGPVDAMLQPRPPARLRVPDALVRPDRLPPVPDPQLLEEEVGVRYGLVVRDAEVEERPKTGLERDPDPSLSSSYANHRLVHEDGSDQPPLDIEPVADRSQPLDPRRMAS